MLKILNVSTAKAEADVNAAVVKVIVHTIIDLLKG